MTVAELITALSEYPGDVDVCFDAPDGSGVILTDRGRRLLQEWRATQDDDQAAEPEPVRPTVRPVPRQEPAPVLDVQDALFDP